jgi:hypothetical protein
MSFKFQVLSDIHLEFFDMKKYETWISYCKPKCENLFLAGDICCINNEKTKHVLYNTFLSYCNKNWKRTFFVLGNHELYNSSLEHSIKHVDDILSMNKNIFYLNRNSIVVDDIVILGCTLWSHIPKEKYNDIQTNVNDYYKIYQNIGSNKRIDCNTTNEWHSMDATWLKMQLELIKPKKTIVMTHHSPILDTNPIYQDSTIKEAFVTDLYDLNTKSEIKTKLPNYHIFGHTHYNIDKVINNCHFITNQFGYSQKERPGFNFDRVYSI